MSEPSRGREQLRLRRAPGERRIVMLGDTSFGEPYQDRLASRGHEPVLRTRGRDYMIGNFTAMLADADHVIANLETPITDAFPSPFAGMKRYLHYADPLETPAALHRHGIRLVSLANNHMLDYGEPGLAHTQAALDRYGIQSCGAGADAREAAAPHVEELDAGSRTVRVAFLSSFERRARYAERYGFYAGPDRPGVNALSVEEVAASVRALRREDPNCFVIAMPHWGSNYRWVRRRQRAAAQALIGHGVDLVVGHGAHLLQEIERHDGRLIVYGLGNFVFGSPGRYAKRAPHSFSAIATLMLVPRENNLAVELRLHPIVTDNLKTEYRPRFVNTAEFEELLALLRQRSAFCTDPDPVCRGMDEHGRFLQFSVGVRP